MHEDLRELAASLLSHEVEFLVVGSTVLAFYGRPRYTEDLDFWIRPTAKNVERLKTALQAFGFTLRPGALEEFVTADRRMVVLGAKPQAVDLLNSVTGLDFDAAWKNRSQGEFMGLKLSFLSLADFIRSKRAAGRPKDLADLALLEEVIGSLDNFLQDS